MTCNRCHEEISFNQWHSERCRIGWLGGNKPFHLVKPQTSIRAAYTAMLTEAAYARTQP